jgi:hypothetical protein
MNSPAEEHIRDPFVLEFLGLKDEYSESQLEEALIRHLEHFLLELGEDFAFVARQKRLRVGDQWYRVDLLFFHRRLRCLILIDLKLGRFSHADAGQMNLYLNYAREHWTHVEENAPIGLILCSERNEADALYARQPEQPGAGEGVQADPSRRERTGSGDFDHPSRSATACCCRPQDRRSGIAPLSVQVTRKSPAGTAGRG